MNARSARRALLMTLWGVLLAVYIAAKIDFFTRYGAANYVREHSKYWAAMLMIGILIWLLDKFLARRSS